MREPMLSIYVPVFNHEKFIIEAIDSIIKQQTEYEYEVLIGEDCSTDNTRKVLLEYEKKLPSNFYIYYRDHNMNNESVSNALDLMRRCRGKYIIALEGDDFWLDPHKLQKEISFLENNNQYVAVAHNCIVVDKDSNETGEKYPECHDNEYTIDHFVSGIFPGQLTTFMYRYDLLQDFLNSSLNNNISPGDRQIYFYSLLKGKVFCMQDKMSAYRHITNEGTSFSANYSYSYERYEKIYALFMAESRRCNNSVLLTASKLLYLRNLIKGLMCNQLCFRTFKELILKNDIDSNVFTLYFKQSINHHLLKKEIWLNIK